MTSQLSDSLQLQFGSVEEEPLRIQPAGRDMGGKGLGELDAKTMDDNIVRRLQNWTHRGVGFESVNGPRWAHYWTAGEI